jgi:iron complex transport system substrate-binding protein
LTALGLCAEPQRIVSTTPSITDILFALGLGERVVAVTDYCHYPEAARAKPKIGSYLQPDFERIAALRPDLVITEKNPLHITERLRAMRLQVVEIDTATFADVWAGMEKIGAATGRSAEAQRLVTRLRREMGELRPGPAGPVPVMFVVSRSRGALEGLMVAGRQSYVHQLLEAAGGRNVFADAAGSYPKVTLEEVLRRDPAVILDMGEMAETTGVTDERKRAVEQLWTRLPALRAVREKRVRAVADDSLVVPGTRMAEAARRIAVILRARTR